MQVMMWAASLQGKEGVAQEKWMGEVKEFWVERLSKMTISEVGCLVLHWQWKRNKGKQQQQNEQARGRLIYAIDQAHPLGIATVSMIEGILKS
eukprot:4851231-Pyramimonas_sp.AAC.1